MAAGTEIARVRTVTEGQEDGVRQQLGVIADGKGLPAVKGEPAGDKVRPSPRADRLHSPVMTMGRRISPAGIDFKRLNDSV